MPSPRTRTPRAGNPAHRASGRALPIVNETSAGGLVVDVQNGQAFTAVIARRNRGGRLEWCLPKGHLEGAETPEQAAVLGGFRGVGGVSGSGVRSHRPKPAMNPHRCAVVLGLSRPVVRTIPHRATIGHRRPQGPSADGAVVCDDVLGQRRPAARTP